MSYGAIVYKVRRDLFIAIISHGLTQIGEPSVSHGPEKAHTVIGGIAIWKVWLLCLFEIACSYPYFQARNVTCWAPSHQPKEMGNPTGLNKYESSTWLLKAACFTLWQNISPLREWAWSQYLDRDRDSDRVQVMDCDPDFTTCTLNFTQIHVGSQLLDKVNWEKLCQLNYKPCITIRLVGKICCKRVPDSASCSTCIWAQTVKKSRKSRNSWYSLPEILQWALCYFQFSGLVGLYPSDWTASAINNRPA